MLEDRGRGRKCRSRARLVQGQGGTPGWGVSFALRQQGHIAVGLGERISGVLLFRLGNICGENAFMFSSGTRCKADLGRSIVPLEQAQSRVRVRSRILSGIGWLRARPLRRTNLGFILMEINRVG